MSLVNVYLEGFHKTASLGIANITPTVHVPTDRLAQIQNSLPQGVQLEQYLFQAIEVLQIQAHEQDKIIKSVEDFCAKYLEALKQGPANSSGTASNNHHHHATSNSNHNSNHHNNNNNHVQTNNLENGNVLEGNGDSMMMGNGVQSPDRLSDSILDEVRRDPTNMLSSHFEDAKKRRGNLPKAATGVLKKWLFDHLFHPYPTEEEKSVLGQQTGLTMNQISNWFINARRRILQPMLESVRQAQAVSEIDHQQIEGIDQQHLSVIDHTHHGGMDHQHHPHMLL